MKLLDWWRNPGTDRRAGALLALCLLAFTYVHFSNAWMGEDPYITYRTVDNFVHGFGLTWNTAERTQAYTHPLWMFLLSAAYAFTNEAFYTTLVICFACTVATLFVVWRSERGPWYRPLVITALFVGSKAFVDYSSSGLENPLTDLVLAVFCTTFLRDRERFTARDVLFLTFVGALGFVNREDTVLIVGPALAWLYITQARKIGVWRTVGIVVVGTAPAWGWLIFSTTYYGFPFPNTAYSKLSGGQGRILHPNALVYFVNSLRWDPLTLPVVLAALVSVAVAHARRAPRVLGPTLLATGMLLYLAYVVRIGGDYMSGRFFAAPFLLSMILLVHGARGPRSHLALAGAVAIAIVVGPRPPVLSTIHYDPLPIDPTGIRDERGSYHNDSSFLTVFFRNHATPGTAMSLAGRTLRVIEPKVMIWGAIGYEGFVAGPNIQTIDPIGLPDPLMARLPAVNVELGWGRGHLFRQIPEGYIASLELGENLIADPALHDYYELLRVITRGELFTSARFRTIWRMNRGVYQPLLDAVVKHAPPPAALKPEIVRGAPGRADALAGIPAEEREVLAPLVAQGLRVLADVRDLPLPTDLDYDLGVAAEPFVITTRRDRPAVSFEHPTVPYVKRRGDNVDAAVIANGHVVALRWRHGGWPDPSALGALRELRLLDLYDGGLRSLASIEKLEKLQYLDVSRNALETLAPVASLSRLRILYAAQTGVRQLEGLRGLGELRELNLAMNGLEGIEGLDGAIGKHLSYLSFEGNPIARIDGLSDLGELRLLNLAFCRITRIENLAPLHKLQYLNLYHNGIRLVKGLEQAPSLYYVALGENPFDFARDNLELWHSVGAMKFFYLN